MNYNCVWDFVHIEWRPSSISEASRGCQHIGDISETFDDAKTHEERNGECLSRVCCFHDKKHAICTICYIICGSKNLETKLFNGVKKTTF